MRTTTRRSLLAERTLFNCGKLSICSIAGMAGYARKSRGVDVVRLSLSSHRSSWLDSGCCIAAKSRSCYRFRYSSG